MSRGKISTVGPPYFVICFEVCPVVLIISQIELTGRGLDKFKIDDAQTEQKGRITLRGLPNHRPVGTLRLDHGQTEN
jgi:hypothetical protein